MRRRMLNVAEFDRFKRHEQRAMQNEEASEVEGKLVKFHLFKHVKGTKEEP